nr:V-type ATP synthase subunit A [Candidatus Krumholzibacteriota bacterium]
KVFWALEDQLAFERHFPAIGWLTSYSLYHDNLADYMRNEVSHQWAETRVAAMGILQKEEELKELVRLVGLDSLSDNDRVVLETAKHIREDFLHQSAFDAVDAYTRMGKQFRMLDTIIRLHGACERAIEKKVPLRRLLELNVRESIARMRSIPEDDIGGFDAIQEEIEKQIAESSAESRHIEA